MRVVLYFILLSGFLCSCTTQEISRNFYEGIKDRNRTVRSMPPEESSGPTLNYDEYKRERKKLKDTN